MSKELIENKKNGYLVPAYKLNEFVDCVKDIIDNPIQAKKISETAVDTARKFSPNTVVKQWIDLLNNLR